MGVIYASELDDSVRHVVAMRLEWKSFNGQTIKRKILVVPGWTKKAFESSGIGERRSKNKPCLYVEELCMTTNFFRFNSISEDVYGCCCRHPWLTNKGNETGKNNIC